MPDRLPCGVRLPPTHLTVPAATPHAGRAFGNVPPSRVEFAHAIRVERILDLVSSSGGVQPQGLGREGRPVHVATDSP